MPKAWIIIVGSVIGFGMVAAAVSFVNSLTKGALSK